MGISLVSVGHRKRKQQKQEKELAMNVSVKSMIVNIVLSLFKVITGIVGKSSAMISDGIHSASDVFSTVIVMIGIHIASRKSDADHQYGHERMECVAAILLATVLFLTGLGIGYSGIRTIAAAGQAEIAVPGLLALIAAVVSILVKEGMFWYTRAAAKKINSGALMADAWHHRSDALSSIGSFVGILAARLGFPIFDPIASFIICLFILKAAIDIFIDAVNKMVDKSCDEKTLQEMRELVMAQSGVVAIDDLKTRMFGSKIYVDIEVSADGNLTLFEAHEIAHRVHDVIEGKEPLVKHCMVHMNPK